MASQLTQVSENIRQFGPAIIISVISVLLIWNLGKAGYQACCTHKATPTPPVTVAFGPLEQLQFKDPPPRSTGVKINLETINGQVPPLATQSAIVYEISKRTAGLSYAEKSTEVAQKMGLKSPTQQQDTPNTFLFINPVDQNERLQYDFVYNNLKYKYENMTSYVSLEIGSAPSIAATNNLARSIINSIRPEILQQALIQDRNYTGSGVYYYVEPATGEQKEVPTQTQANLTVLDFNRSPINGYPFIGPSTTQSLMRFVYTGITTSSTSTQRQSRLLEAALTYWELDTKNPLIATYPLRTPSEAWSELLAGKGYILNQTNPNDEFNVRKIYLAYYQPEILAKYVQPVWVFEGDKPNDSKFLFRAIIPAVSISYAAPL